MFNLHQSAIIRNAYNFNNVENPPIENNRSSSHLGATLAEPCAVGYAAKRGVNMLWLVLLFAKVAFEAMMQSPGLFLGVYIMEKMIGSVFAAKTAKL